MDNRLKELVIIANQRTREWHYWREKMAGELVKSSIMPDRVTGGGRREMETRTFEMGAEAAAQLERLSKQSDIKRHQVLVAVMAHLLYRYTGNGDVVVGTPIYRQEGEGAVEDYINTELPLRIRQEERQSFREYLAEVRRTVVAAVEHQSFPMEILCERLNKPRREGEEHPLYDVSVEMESIHDRRCMEKQRINQMFRFRTQQGQYRCEVEYNREKYGAATLQRVLRQVETLLANAAAEPDRPMEQLEIIRAEEKRQILEQFNDTDGEFPEDRTIHRIFMEQVEAAPDRTAVRYEDRHISYAELERRARIQAYELRKKGVGRDSIVGLMEERSLEMIIGIMAILTAGGAYLPIDPRTPGNRVETMLEDSRAPVLLTTAGTLKRHAHTYTALKGIKNRDAKLHRTPPRPAMTELDSRPMPDRSMVDYEKYHRYINISSSKGGISIQASRGCPYGCVYCHKIWPKKTVMRSAESIYREVRFHYDRGIRRFVFVDDIFNLDEANGMRFFDRVIAEGMDIQLFFSAGLRGDILGKEYIDGMMEAGTVNINMSLETASPRLQRMMGKNLNIDKLEDNLHYISRNYPHVMLELETMHGFPTETEEEALETLNLIKRIRWLHFPYLNTVRIYHNTEMEQLAVRNGVSAGAIERSVGLAYHELPETLPFEKSFTLKCQADFFNDYFMSGERLRAVLPYQMKLLSDDELVQKYDSYLPVSIRTVEELLNFLEIDPGEMGTVERESERYQPPPGLNLRLREAVPQQPPDADAIRVLLLDLSQAFSSETGMLYDVVEPPLGLMYLSTHLKNTLGTAVELKIAKSRIDFDGYRQLKRILEDFKADVIGIRTLTIYKDFFHEAVAAIRQWGIETPIIAGGPYATSDYGTLLQDRNVDVAVMGEGELTLEQLIETMRANGNRLPGEDGLKEIPGIVFVEGRDRGVSSTIRDIQLMDHVIEKNREIYREINSEINRELERESEGEIDVENINEPWDLAYNIYTSGSTGQPKGVLLEHGHLVNLVWYHLYHSGLNMKRVLQFATINFDVSLQEIFPTLLGGGTLYLIHRDHMTDIAGLFEHVQKNDIKTMFLPASFLKFVLNEPEYVRLLPRSVEHIVPAGEQLIVTEAFRRYLRNNKIRLHNHYGPSETHLCTVLTMDPQDEIPELPDIGAPTLNARVYILDRQLNLQPVGVPGEIYIGGSQVSRGFLNRPEQTAQKFPIDPYTSPQSTKVATQPFAKRYRGSRGSLPLALGEPAGGKSTANRMYRSGDQGRWREDGRIEFLGRVDFQVKIRGHRVELGEIESRLLEIDGIKEAAVVDRRDRGGQTYLCAYIVTDGTVDREEIKGRLGVHLPDYMVPAAYVEMEAIPLTFNRKVDRKALPEPGSEAVQRKGEGKVKPRNSLEHRLAEQWAQVLEIERDVIGIDDNYFDIGGHSLNATILMGKIHKYMGVRVRLSDIFVSPTIRELADYLEKNGGEDKNVAALQEPIPRAAEREFYPLSPAQERLFIHHQVQEEHTGYNLCFVLEMRGRLQRERLDEVFRQLVERHESLRTAFEIRDDEPVQRIEPKVELPVEEYEASDNEIETIYRSFIRPFRLEQAPLMRVGFVKINRGGGASGNMEDRYVLLVDMHHIVTDGMSTGIMVKEFIALYIGETLPAQRIRYRDYAEWQQQKKRDGRLRRQESYWLNRFSDGVPNLNMPTDRPRTANRGFEGASVHREMDPRQTARIKQRAQEAGTTVNIYLLAAFTLLLSKYTGQEDIVVGNGIAGRNHPDTENIMGVFINMLAMRNKPLKELTYNEYLEEVKQNSVDAYENQDYQFDDLVNALGLQGNPSRNPLFDFVIQMQNFSIPVMELPGLEIRPYPMNTSVTHFDLVLYTSENKQEYQQEYQHEREESISINYVYSTALFNESTVRDIGDNFIEVLEQIVENGNVRLEDIVISTKHAVAQPRIQKEAAQFEF